MKVKAPKRYFLCTNADIVTILKKCSKLVLNKHNILLSGKSNEATFFSKECNKLLLIRDLVLNVTVPLQLLVTAI